VVGCNPPYMHPAGHPVSAGGEAGLRVVVVGERESLSDQGGQEESNGELPCQFYQKSLLCGILPKW
jgi:hypothetical protein